MSARSTAQLRATLEAFSCTAPLTADVGAPVVRVSLQSVSVSGTVEALNRKGRRFLLYELDVSADWKAVLEPAHGPPVPAEPSATAAGEDDEALARRLQAEEDALSAAALSEGGCVLGRLSASDWTHDEEDEPPFQLERKSSEPFVPPVSADGVYGLVRKLLPRACAGALKGWAVLVRQDATQPGGPTQGNDAPLTNPPPPPPAQPAPAPPPAAAAPEPRASVGGGGGVSRASDDPAELCREAIGAYCTKQRLSSGSASELSLRGLRLGTSEAAIVCRLLRMDESRALRSLDLSHNALGDQGLDELVEALAAGGGAHALARLCLGANANISREARESACARLRAARPLLEVSWDGNDAAAAGGGAGGGAGNARPFISVGVVHAGARTRARCGTPAPLAPRAYRVELARPPPSCAHARTHALPPRPAGCARTSLAT
jgi:hypothetical protein